MATHPIAIYGAPMDLGQQRRGVDMGPSAIRYANLRPRLERLGLKVRDYGNVPVPGIEQVEKDDHDPQAHNAVAVAAVADHIRQTVIGSIGRDETTLFLGGDHSVAMGTVSAALTRPGRVGVLWIDAHGDFNTPETTPSGNVHGMVVTSLMGRCPPPLVFGEKRLQADQIVMLGIRDLDSLERVALRESGITVMTMREIDENGIAAVTRMALQILGPVDALHISFDMDSLDPTVAPGVGTRVPGGLGVREAHLLMEILCDDGRVRSLDLVEVNPILDEFNRTAELAVDLAASLFGQRII
jgi:arginase